MVDSKTTEEKKIDKMISQVESFIRDNRNPKPNIGLQIIKMSGIVEDGRAMVNSLELSLRSMKSSPKITSLKGRMTEFNVKFNKLDA